LAGAAALAVALGAYAFTRTTPQSASLEDIPAPVEGAPMVTARFGSSDYPPIAVRLTALIDGYSQPENSNFWLFVSCLLIGILRQDRRPLDITPTSNEELAKTLLSQLA
ncbi:hypothetical protein KUV57_24955, partial [Epibacterium sp. DP7N7-1]|nr:hypothetical protein [Epibacterium sp. DP7N7-1]